MAVTTDSIGGVPSTNVRLLSERSRTLVLVIPGNPGVARLYEPFAARLFALGQGALSVAVAGHAGHAPGHRPQAADGFFSLADQHRHHLAFLATLPPSPMVHLVGHSIGAWLALGLLDSLPKRGRAILLFPTIERMAQSPAGRAMAPLFGAARGPTILLARLMRRLPGRDRVLLRTLLGRVSPEDRPGMLEGILQLDADSLQNVLRMAGEELATVTELPQALIRRHTERLTLYYGAADRWNLPGMADEVRSRFPDTEVVRSTDGPPHAFMLDDSAAMAAFVHARV